MSSRLALMLSLTLILAAPAAAAWRPDGNPVAIVRGFAAYVRATSDGAGGSYFAWKQLGPTTGDTSYVGPDLAEPATLRVQHLDPDGNATWGSGGLVVAVDQTGHELLPDFATPDGAGGIVVGWHGTDTPFRAQRFDTRGRALWEPGGRPLATQPARYPVQTIEQPGGDVLVVSDASAQAIVARRYSGSSGAPVDDVGELCAGASGSRSVIYSQVAQDGEGGSVVTWFDSRGIVAQRVDARGHALWGPTGALIAPIGANNGAKIDSDGSGGALLLWYGERDYRFGYFVERVRDGVPTWSSAGGIQLDAYLGGNGIDIVSDGADGAWIFGVPFPIDGGIGELVAEHIVDGVEGGPIELGPVSGNVVDLIKRNGSIDIVLLETSFIEGIQWRSIRVVRLDADGSLPWGQSGAKVITSPYLWDTFEGEILPQEDGGLIAGWFDRRTDPLGDLYAQRLDANGDLHGAASVPAVQMLSVDPTPTATGAASLRFVLGKTANVSVRLVDVSGRVVRRLAQDDAFSVGEHAIAWDGKDNLGRAVRAGLYFVDLRAGETRVQGRIVVTR